MKNQAAPKAINGVDRTVDVLAVLCKEFCDVDFKEVSRLARNFGMDFIYLPTLQLEHIMKFLGVKGMFAHRLQLAACTDRDSRFAMGAAFQCPVCGQTFAYKELTESHIAVDHGRAKLKLGTAVKQEVFIVEDVEEEVGSPIAKVGVEEVPEVLQAGEVGGRSVDEEALRDSQV